MSIRSLNELAIFSGRKILKETLHVGRPNKGRYEHFLKLAGEIFDRQWLTNNGPVVRNFEGKVAALIGVKHCIAVCNATNGLQLLFHALDLRGEVIMPSFTFAASAHAASWIGLKPVFCDVDINTHNIDPNEIEKLINDKTCAILGVHLWGNPCNIEKLTEISERNKVKLIFDAAQAFGSKYSGKMLGGFGEAEVFSFHATKMIHAFEGGIISTNNSVLAEKLRKMRNFGISGSGKVECLGTNAKLPEMSAAMGLVMLNQIDRLTENSISNFQIYKSELLNIPGIKLFNANSNGDTCRQYIVMLVNGEKSGISRDQLAEILIAEGIEVKKYFNPGCHRISPYNKKSYDLPVTEQLCEQSLVLPGSENITNTHIQFIADIIRFAVSQAPELITKMKSQGKYNVQ